MSRNRELKYSSVLLLAAFIWGLAFVAQAMAAEYVPAFAFNGARFLIGASSLLPVAAIFERNATHKGTLRLTYTVGVVCGVIVFAAAALQQIGIEMGGGAGKSGFITGLYIVFVPFVGLMFGHKIGAFVVAGAVFACSGLYFVSVPDGFGSVTATDVILFFNAVLWSFQISVIGKYSPAIYSIRFSIAEFLTCGVLSALCSVAFERGAVTLTGFASAVMPLLYCGALSVGIAYTLQSIGQKGVSPGKSAIIFSTESLFAALGGALVLGERMSLKGYFGCGLILIGILVSQIEFKIKPRGRD